MSESAIRELFRGMFNPINYDIDHTKKLLIQYGGILCLLNDLKTNHREGLSSYQPNGFENRSKAFGRNQLPPGQSLLKKSISEQRDFMVNLLFYLLTLRVCVKLLLVRDQFYGIESMGGANESYQLSIYDQLISYILLFIMIFLKARVNIEYFEMDQDKRKYRNQKIKVKRDAEYKQIEEKDLLVGDILIAQEKQTIRVDGIVLSAKQFIVNEGHTILREDSKEKLEIWEETGSSDPFILSGSTVIKGQAQILVCNVGENCSFRIQKELESFRKQGGKAKEQGGQKMTKEEKEQNNFLDTPPFISRYKKMIGYIEDFAKILCVVLATLKALSFLHERSNMKNVDLGWKDFLYVLKIYCAFIGLICFLQRLKILKSVTFFMEDNRCGECFTIEHKSSFEKLTRMDVLFVQLEAITIYKKRERQRIHYTLEKLNQITIFNIYYNTKIITDKTKSQVQQIFSKNLDDSAFFEPDEIQSNSNKINKLMKATFITETTFNYFIANYLPIFEAIKCDIGYVSYEEPPIHRQLPKNVLHIGFYKKQDYQILQNRFTKFENNESCWIKLKNLVYMEQTLQQIFQYSFVYANLFNTYFSLFINNAIVFLMFCWFSFFKKPVNLYFSLAIIIVNRYLFFTVFRRIARGQRSENQIKISFFEIFKLNALLLPYYLYVATNLNFISNFFIFFLANSMLRIETLLCKLNTRQSLLCMLRYTVIIAIVNFVNVSLWLDKIWVSEELQNLGYTFGLIIFFFLYAPLA